MIVAPAFFGGDHAGGGAVAQTAGVVRFGRVMTAAYVRGWGDYVVRDQFLPGERVWLYAETLGTVRNGHVDLMFHFVVTDDGGRAVYDSTAEFSEASSWANWGAWRSFMLPVRAQLGTYTLKVEVLNRITGERGSKDFPFKVVSAANTLPAATPNSDEPEATGPLSPDMEEAFALLGQRPYRPAVRRAAHPQHVRARRRGRRPQTDRRLLVVVRSGTRRWD